MTRHDHPWYTNQPATRIAEKGDRWRCSLCGGYVRGDAPRCKHCHALFQESEPVSQYTTTRLAPADSPPFQWMLRGLAACGTAIFLGIGAYVSWSAGTYVGGMPGVAVGWTLGMTLALLVFGAWVYAERPSNEWRIGQIVIDFLRVWFMLFIVCVVPLVAAICVAYVLDDWFDKPLAMAMGFTLAIISLAALDVKKAESDATLEGYLLNNQPADQSESLFRLWLKSMLISVLPFSMIMWIGSYMGRPWSTALWIVLIVLIQPGVRGWLSQQVRQWTKRGVSQGSDEAA